MRAGLICEMFAKFPYPQEGQAVLKHVGRARLLFSIHPTPVKTHFIK